MGLNHSIKETLERGILLENQPKGLRGIVFPCCRSHRNPEHKCTVPERATLSPSDLLFPWLPHMGIITQEQMGSTSLCSRIGGAGLKGKMQEGITPRARGELDIVNSGLRVFASSSQCCTISRDQGESHLSAGKRLAQAKAIIRIN